MNRWLQVRKHGVVWTQLHSMSIAGTTAAMVCAIVAILLSQTEELAKAGICAHDRCALQQLALNVHVKHSDLT